MYCHPLATLCSLVYSPKTIHPSINFLYPLNPSVGSRGGWSLSQRSSGKRWGTPCTGGQYITGQGHTETNNHISIMQLFIWFHTDFPHCLMDIHLFGGLIWQKTVLWWRTKPVTWNQIHTHAGTNQTEWVGWDEDYEWICLFLKGICQKHISVQFYKKTVVSVFSCREQQWLELFCIV